MLKKYRSILFVPFLLLGACSSGDEQTTTEKSSDDHILKNQMRALEKAKGVEQMLQQGADRNRQAIEEQSISD